MNYCEGCQKKFSIIFRVYNPYIWDGGEFFHLCSDCREENKTDPQLFAQKMRNYYLSKLKNQNVMSENQGNQKSGMGTGTGIFFEDSEKEAIRVGVSKRSTSSTLPLKVDFGYALLHLKDGYRIAREGWNGKGMWLKLILGHEYAIDTKVPINSSDFERTYNLLPFIGMKTADNQFVPWLASQTDILATDWMIL